MYIHSNYTQILDYMKKKKKFTFFLCNFSVRTLFKIFFLIPKKWKNRPKKLLIIGPDPFLRQSSPGHSPQPRSSFPFYKKSNATLSLLLSEWTPLRYCVFAWIVGWTKLNWRTLNWTHNFYLSTLNWLSQWKCHMPLSCQ